MTWPHFSIREGLRQMAAMMMEEAKEKLEKKLGRLPSVVRLIKAERMMEEYNLLCKSAVQMAALGARDFRFPPMQQKTAEYILQVMAEQRPQRWFQWTIWFNLDPAMLLHIAHSAIQPGSEEAAPATTEQADGFLDAYNRLIEYKRVAPEVVIELARGCAEASNYRDILRREQNRLAFRSKWRLAAPSAYQQDGNSSVN